MGFSRLTYHVFGYSHSLQEESSFNLFKSKSAKLLVLEGFYTKIQLCDIITIFYIICLELEILVAHHK